MNFKATVILALSLAFSSLAHSQGIVPRPGGAPNYKSSVPSSAALPATGNDLGDMRIDLTLFHEWVWNGTSWQDNSGGGGGGGVSSFNTRTGAVSLTNGDVLAALGITPENIANKSTDGTMAANSDTLYPSQKATRTYVASQISGIPTPTPFNGVSSVSNSDGTLTISPTTGAVVASRPAIIGDISILAGSNSAALTATTNSTITTLPSLSLPYSQLTGTPTPYPVFTGDSGTGGTVGLVPSPSPGTSEQNYVLGANGSFNANDTSKPLYPPFTLQSQTLPPNTDQKFANALMVQNGFSTYAVVGGGTTETVAIYNVTDQTQPKLRGSINLSGTYGVCGSSASWPYVFVPGSGARTLTVLNISNPLVPTVTATYSWAANTTSIYSCSYSNGLVFMAGQNHGLGILDVGNGVSGGTITAPVLAFDEGTQAICSVALSCKSFGVAVDPVNQIVYSADFSTATPWTYRQLKAYSYASSITSPTLLQNLTLPANTKTGAVSLNLGTKTAFVTDTNQNVYDIIDTTNVSTGGMTFQASITPSGSRAVPVAGTIASVSGSNFVYVPSGSASIPGQIEFYDITTRSSPIKVNGVTDGTALSTSNVFGNIAIDPRGSYIFAAAYGNGTTGSSLETYTMPYETASVGNVYASHLILPGGDVQSQISAIVSGSPRTSNTVTTTFTIPTLTKDYILNANSTGGSFTVTLPDAVASSNFCLDVKNIGPNSITLTPAGANTIDGNATFVDSVQNQSTKVCSVNSNWYIY